MYQQNASITGEGVVIKGRVETGMPRVSNPHPAHKPRSMVSEILSVTKQQQDTAN